MDVIIRKAKREDCEAIASLIKELAAYEKMEDQAKLDAACLQRDGFGSNPPYFHCLVAEAVPQSSDSSEPKRVFGYALYYYTYSTWRGKGIHLEDFYVTPEFRHKGTGKQLIKELAKIGVEGDFCRITLECLDWNQLARDFYDKLQAVNYTEKHGWHTYRFVREVMEKLASD